ncbi:MAG: hypothetical protein AVDCRST_MAG12-3451, partial [uncultured Rubrobacteraceae bacterium]
ETGDGRFLRACGEGTRRAAARACGASGQRGYSGGRLAGLVLAAGHGRRDRHALRAVRGGAAHGAGLGVLWDPAGQDHDLPRPPGAGLLAGGTGGADPDNRRARGRPPLRLRRGPPGRVGVGM